MQELCKRLQELCKRLRRQRKQCIPNNVRFVYFRFRYNDGQIDLVPSTILRYLQRAGSVICAQRKVALVEQSLTASGVEQCENSECFFFLTR
jgi:hypothetical protein